MSYPKIPLFIKEHPQYNYILFIIWIAFLACTPLQAQRPVYKITATLDTVSHTLKGAVSISYTNNSYQSLDKLGLHLWANAFKVNHSALAMQKLHQGDLTLYRAEEKDLGGLYDLNFSSPDQSVLLEEDAKHIDIAWITLSKPLMPGETIHLLSDYTLRIPISFSRLGRTGTSYQLTQWYPHIAVFDEEGWHTMPNLDQGEYFNDFADYEVMIQTPSTYKVAATGSLMKENQKGALTERTYSASNVIDFAWFASPHYLHTSEKINVEGSGPIEINLFVENFLNDDWESAMLYAERAVKFYSKWVGPYPYPQMTVVHTPFSKAGYMEYPMVAQIGYTSNPEFLDRVIAHEIGHTWLYGILANNERENSWLDEGFNSFLENEYMHTYYKDPVEIIYPGVVHNKNSMDHYDALQHMVRSAGDVQPPAVSPVWQQNNQYILSAYLLPSQSLKLMKEKLGSEKMQQMFKDYFDNFKFSHVSSLDVRNSFEKSCVCDLSWFFDGWLHYSHEIDYRIRQSDFKKNTLTLENKAAYALPILVTEYGEGEKIKTHWLDGFHAEKEITLQPATDEIRLYDGIMGSNKKWWDNIRPRQLLPVIRVVPKIGNYQKPTLAFTPVMGYNISDGGLPGIAITTDLLPQPRLKLFLMPMYGIESEKFRYYGEGRYVSDLSNGTFDKFLLGLSGSSFSYDVDTTFAFSNYYVRLSPYAGLRLNRSSLHSHLTSWLKYRYVDISQYYADGLGVGNPDFEKEQRRYGVHEISFQMNDDTVLQPFGLTSALQMGKGFMKINFHYNQHFRGKDKMRGIWVHGFLGWLPVYDNPVANVIFTLNGTASNDYFSRDYMYDEWLLGRNATEGNVSRQIFLKDAGFKTLAQIGFSNSWMAGAGLSVALPFKVVHLYMDAAVFDDDYLEKTTLSYSGGLAIILMKDAFEIYIPILESKNIRESLTYFVRDKWYDRISFQANFKLANPLNLVDRFQYKY